MYRFRKSFMALAMTLALGGTCFQLAGCDLVSGAAKAIANINPCGTILACDPALYEFANSGIDGPGVRPDLDPFCTYPPFCSTDVDPIYGGLSLYGPP
jgi:hypothetical protein